MAPLALAVLTGMQAKDAVADRSCDDGPLDLKVKVRVVQDRPVEILVNGKNADPLHVCLGDRVEWQLQGSAKSFYIRFPEKSPFSDENHARSNNGKIEATIDTGNPGDSFKYDIGLDDGEVWDPRIVIDD